MFLEHIFVIYSFASHSQTQFKYGITDVYANIFEAMGPVKHALFLRAALETKQNALLMEETWQINKGQCWGGSWVV